MLTKGERYWIGAAVGTYTAICAYVFSNTTTPVIEATPAIMTGQQQLPIIPITDSLVAKASPTPQPNVTPGILTLSSKNTFVFRGVVTSQSVAKAQQALIEMSGKLDEDEAIYLILDTPGGSVMDGNTFIDTVNGLPQKVKTVTLFAASMGFHFVQNMNERYITPSGILMSHRATMGMEGEVPGEFITRLNFFLRVMNRMDTQAAKRMGMDIGVYQDMIRDEYWVEGNDAVTSKAADKVTIIRCASDMMQTEELAVNTIFGKLSVKFSKCPLIAGPLAIDMAGMVFPSNEAKQDFNEHIDTLMNDKKAYVKRYIETNKYMTYFRN